MLVMLAGIVTLVNASQSEKTKDSSVETPSLIVRSVKPEQAANALMSAKGYLEYVKKHGYHFTEELAEHASKMMINANKQQHSWTASLVKKSMDNLGLSLSDNMTLGDATYVANMYYADFYPDIIKDEASCLKAVHKIANDPDGYKGMIFCRWTADVIGKAIKLNWEKFV